VTAILLSMLLAASCPAPATRLLPTIGGYGDSIMFGVGGGSPLARLDSTLPGGASYGWLTSNRAVSGETAAQIRTRYTAEEATACDGKRCAVLFLEGGVNSLRSGVTPAATLTDMVWIVDDALAKGIWIVWLDVTPYGSFSGAGTNPQGQATGYNAAMAIACAARVSSRLRCVFNYAALENPATPGTLLATYNSGDGIHLSVAGANYLGDAAYVALLQMAPLGLVAP